MYDVLTDRDKTKLRKKRYADRKMISNAKGKRKLELLCDS